MQPNMGQKKESSSSLWQKYLEFPSLFIPEPKETIS